MKSLFITIISYILFQKRQEDGTNSTAEYGRSRTSTDKNAQLSIIRIQPFEGQFLQIEHIMERQLDGPPLTY